MGDASKEPTDQKLYESYLFYNYWKVERHFKFSEDANETKTIAINLLDAHKDDVMNYGNDEFIKFNDELSKNRKLDPLSALLFFDKLSAAVRNSLRNIYFNQIRQIELIQYAAMDTASQTLEHLDRTDPIKFYTRYMQFHQNLSEVYKAVVQQFLANYVQS
ncbi:hypothetical protein L0F63_000527 [Massospora cicadina]|nr:hypothetical protein L0F63_000527 [Massospora cicadina]